MSCKNCRKKIKNDSLTKCNVCKANIDKVPDFSVEIVITIGDETKTFFAFKNCFKFEIPAVPVEKLQHTLNEKFENKVCIVEYFQQEKKKDGAEDTSDNYPILYSFDIKSDD